MSCWGTIRGLYLCVTTVSDTLIVHFRLILAHSKVKYTIWESFRHSTVCVSPYFCDALTMAAASVCSTAIYEGTDQGGVWMKPHEVTQSGISSIGIYQCLMVVVRLHFPYGTFQLKFAALVDLRVHQLSGRLLVLVQQ